MPIVKNRIFIEMNLRESIKKILKEDRFKGYKRFLKDNVFMDFPDYIINDMFRESGDLDYSQVQGMTKKQIIDYFLNGEGHKFFDRWGGYKGQKPKVVEIKWNDLTEPLQKFLKNKMSGENPNFPDSREKIVQMMNREPNLGKGDNEPVLLKYNNEGKIEDIPGGNHRTYVAFELNNFNPILMKAYVDNDPKPNLQESIKRILRENVNQITIRRRIYELDNLLAELVRTTYSPNKICKYSNSEQFIEHLIYNIINDHIYYIYFEHIDSSSKEWESLYRKMEEYLRIKYENKLDEYYHMNCGD